jgi:peptidoglycan hydrolase-like protein with peptidoglycan-binding domain
MAPQPKPVPKAAPVVAVPKAYTDIILRKGDNDKKKIYSGKVDATIGGDPIHELQKALKAVGVYDGIIDGDFGGGTDTAVRRFQWNVRNLSYWYVAGAVTANPPQPAIPVSGVADAATTKELKRWVDAGAKTTGNLVRVQFSSYSEFTKGDGFQRIANPNVTDADIVIDADSTDLLDTLNTKAKDAGITLTINQVFRVAGVPVRGAVVKPASSSQHLIGNAVDTNPKDGTDVMLTSTFKAKKESENTKKFVKAVKDAGYRWGGDFKDKDYIHFDGYIEITSDAFLMRYFFNQRMIADKHPIPSA